MKHIATYSWCQHDINWIAYYKYFEKYGLLSSDKNFKIFDIWYDLACSCGWCYTFKNIVFVCEKPITLNLNERGQLHKDNQMALEYTDGEGLYMLNGIRVPKWLILNKAEDIDVSKVFEEKNIDVQREIIRKIGAEKVLKKSGAKEISIYTDSRTSLTYKLMVLKIGDNIDRKYLYFEHATMKGIFYAQPVPPETTKALHGLAWQRCMIEREELKSIDIVMEAEIIANLPEMVQ